MHQDNPGVKNLGHQRRARQTPFENRVAVGREFDSGERMDGDTEAIETLETNGFYLHPAATIAMATAVGLGAMMPVTMLGAHVFAAMGALLGGIRLVLGIFSGKVSFRLTETGLHREFRPFLSAFMGSKTHAQFFPCDSITSFKRDRDFSRSMKETEFLKISLRDAPFTILITDQVNAEGFTRFADAFVAQVENLNRKRTVPLLPPSVGTTPVKSPPLIRRKKSFYETVFAKLLTILFLFSSVALVLAVFSGEARWTYVIKLGIVILPGTAYLVWRVFIKKKDGPV